MLGMFSGDLPEPWTASSVSFDHGQRLVHGGAFRAYIGNVVGVKTHHRLGCRYDVELNRLDESGNPITIYECKQLLQRAGYDGIVSAIPLQEGEPVVVLCTEGEFSEGTILGSYCLPGKYEDYYHKGSMGKPMTSRPGLQDEIVESNPASVYPYRVQIPTSYNQVIPGSNVTSPHDDPSYYHKQGSAQARRKDKVKARPQYVGLQHLSEACMVDYHMGPVAMYSDTATLVINQSTGESKCARLERHAAYYGAMYSKLASTIGLEITVDDGPQTLIPPGADEQIDSYASSSSSGALHGGTPSATKEWWNTIGESSKKVEPVSPRTGKGANISDSLLYNDPDSVNYLEPLPIEYQMDQLYKLTLAYRESAKECGSAETTVKTAQAVTVQRQESSKVSPQSALSKQKATAPNEVGKTIDEANSKDSKSPSTDEVKERKQATPPDVHQSTGTSADRNKLELKDLLESQKKALGLTNVGEITVQTLSEDGHLLHWTSGRSQFTDTQVSYADIGGQSYMFQINSNGKVDATTAEKLFGATVNNIQNLYKVSPTIPGGASTNPFGD